MKARDMKYNEKSIELMDGRHKIAIDFNAFEALEEIYGDMQTAFSKFTNKNVRFSDVKNFITAGINACIEDTDKHYTPFEIGKLLYINKLGEYASIIMELLKNAMPQKNSTESEDEKEDEKN